MNSHNYFFFLYVMLPKINCLPVAVSGEEVSGPVLGLVADLECSTVLCLPSVVRAHQLNKGTVQ